MTIHLRAKQKISKNVKKMAVKLARRWGTDPEKAAMAAILHDSAKELPKQEFPNPYPSEQFVAVYRGC